MSRRFRVHPDVALHLNLWRRLERWRCAVTVAASLPVFLLSGSGSPATASSPAPATRHDTPSVQALSDSLRAALAIPEEVVVAIVPENALLVSVVRLPDRPRAFLLSIEEAFLATLDDEELRAVVAHELGHVWIFTHHPFLQTEQLANRIAMRVVSRESLERVYPKVWERTGAKGDLERFLGR
jgi:hypothetical protein